MIAPQNNTRLPFACSDGPCTIVVNRFFRVSVNQQQQNFVTFTRGHTEQEEPPNIIQKNLQLTLKKENRSLVIF